MKNYFKIRRDKYNILNILECHSSVDFHKLYIEMLTTLKSFNLISLESPHLKGDTAGSSLAAPSLYFYLE